jgi:hypothetical protein
MNRIGAREEGREAAPEPALLVEHRALEPHASAIEAGGEALATPLELAVEVGFGLA